MDVPRLSLLVFHGDFFHLYSKQILVCSFLMVTCRFGIKVTKLENVLFYLAESVNNCY